MARRDTRFSSALSDLRHTTFVFRGLQFDLAASALALKERRMITKFWLVVAFLVNAIWIGWIGWHAAALAAQLF